MATFNFSDVATINIPNGEALYVHSGTSRDINNLLWWKPEYSVKLGFSELDDDTTSVIDYGTCSYNSTSFNIPPYDYTGRRVTLIDVDAFYDMPSLVSVTLPNTLTEIGTGAFSTCTSLASITFNGTVAQWNAITKGINWNENIPATYVQCTDGTVALVLPKAAQPRIAYGANWSFPSGGTLKIYVENRSTDTTNDQTIFLTFYDVDDTVYGSGSIVLGGGEADYAYLELDSSGDFLAGWYVVGYAEQDGYTDSDTYTYESS